MDKIITLGELLKLLCGYTYKAFHIHHTYSPAHSDFLKNPDGLYWQKSMRDYHLSKNWQDIGQHITLLPDGNFVTGRDFSKNPASITGKNNGAFAVEMLGNFDTGHDILQGTQKASILGLARYFDGKGIPIHFHNEYSLKSCPGSSIHKDKFMQEVRGTEFDKAIEILGERYGIGVAYWNTKKGIDTYFEELMIKIAQNTEVKPVVEAKYRIEGITHIVEIEPMELRAKLAPKIDTVNGVNGNFFDTSLGKPVTIGWLISEGKVLEDRDNHIKWGGKYDYPKGTLIVYKDGKVECGLKTDGQMAALKDVWFACQGFNLFPLDTKKEGYNINEVGRASNRVSIGYNGSKVILAVRPDSDAKRAVKTMSNLGCKQGICLDSGGSTNLRVKGKDIFKTTRTLSNILYWR